VFSTLQPELIKEKAAREELDPAFVRNHPKQLAEDEQQAAEAQRNTAISRAIVDDFKEMRGSLPRSALRQAPTDNDCYALRSPRA
jgi:hypothetical protein